MVEIRRTYRFCASHRLYRSDWADKRNERVYGPSANESGHGHNFRLTLAIRGEPDPETHRLVDLRSLDERIELEVVSVYDHRNLNADVPTLEGRVPTLEVLLKDIWDRSRPLIPPPATLVAIELQVDPFLSGIYTGPTSS